MNNPLNTYIAGHSLGGGLASAASLMSGFHAYTFNAAGLHEETVAGMNLGNAGVLIDAFQVDYDILSWGQYHRGWLTWLFGNDNIPQAVGTSHILDSQYDFEIVAHLMLGPFLLDPEALSSLIDVGIACHGMDQVIYGIEKRVF